MILPKLPLPTVAPGTTKLGMIERVESFHSARHLQRRSHIGIQIAHGIETLGAGKIQVIAQSQVECELVRRFPVILDESSKLKVLRTDELRDFVFTPRAGSTYPS